MKIPPSTILLFAILATVLLAGIGSCFAQDSTFQKKYLMIDKIKRSGKSHIIPDGFRIGHKVEVSDTAEHSEKGRIKIITDSSIFLNDKEIMLKQIASIKKIRGRTLSAIAGSLAGAGFVLTLTFGILTNAAHDTYSNHAYEGEFFGALFGTMVAGAGSLVGGIQMGSARRYFIGSKWKFVVKTYDIAGHKARPIPTNNKKDQDK
jgi:hypothetical protein